MKSKKGYKLRVTGPEENNDIGFLSDIRSVVHVSFTCCTETWFSS